MTYRLTFPRIVRSELTKFLTLRSTWIVLGSAAVLTIGVGGIIGWVASKDQQTAPTVAEAVGRAFLGIDIFSLVIGIFGILLMTGEYSSGLIRATLAAVPNRLPVLWAKAAALTVVTLPIMLVICFVSFWLSQSFFDADWRVALSEPGVLRATFGAAVAPVVSALLGLAIGTAIRHTAGAIAAFVAIMLVLPALLPEALPASIRDDVVSYSPVATTQAMYAVSGDNPFRMLSPGHAALVTAGWIVLALFAGAAVLRRRDA